MTERFIDLHSHILPGIDDGAQDLATSLEMARIAVADGTGTMACTPHIYPGLYENAGPGILAARARLQRQLDEAGIALRLSYGADVHLVPGLLDGLRDGRVPTLAGSRYLLLEPSHHVAPPRLAETVFQFVSAGYTPVITHPERLTYIGDHYQTFVDMTRQGAWMQITAGALVGQFGPRARGYAERFVGEGHTHILASDAHTTGRRSPRLSDGLRAAERLVGAEEARRLVIDRPRAILDNLPPSQTAPLPDSGSRRGDAAATGGWWKRLLGGR